jgi:tight adherence protein C
VLAVLGPPVVAVADRVGQLLDSSSDHAVALRLRQAGLFPGTPADRLVAEYRLKQLGTIVGGGAGGATLGVLVGTGTPVRLLMMVLGLVWGGSLWRGRVATAIDDRRARLRIELSTIDQLLAMRIRVGGGVITAVRRTVERGRGAVVDDLAEALRHHRSGLSAPASFRRIAETSPEPHARRTYLLLATAEERGSDLADALLALSHDVRDDRRESLRRAATKRRAAMLLPIVALLAPILIMFVAAPLPWIVFGELR